MRRTNWLFILLFSGVACSPATYKIINDKDVPGPQTVRKFVLIRERYFNRAGHFSNLINSKKWTEFDGTINTLNDFKGKNFLWALRFMMDNQYPAALRSLAYLDDTDFDCQVKILKADCLHEMKADTVDLRQRYQEALDCTSNERVKSIAIDRYRFIKYGI